MTDELKQILCDLIERHGRELVREPKRLEGMLNDACAGQHRGARRVLVDAVQERVVEELLALGPSEQVEVVVGRAQQRLIENPHGLPYRRIPTLLNFRIVHRVT